MDEENYQRIKLARNRMAAAQSRVSWITENGCIQSELKLDGLGLPDEMVERFNKEALAWAKEQQQITEAEFKAL